MDFENYERLLVKKRKRRTEEKKYGNDKCSQINLDNNYFDNYHFIVDSISQNLSDSIFMSQMQFIPDLNNHEQYILLTLVNNLNDTMTVTNNEARLFSLPWTIDYQGKIFWSFDPQITQYVRSTLPRNFNSYEKLLGGKFIYDLIEERIIEEQVYKNGLE